MLLRAWHWFLRPIDPDRCDDAQTREIRFFRIIGLVLALTYPAWYFVNRASVAAFDEPLWPRVAIGCLGFFGAWLTRLVPVFERQSRPMFYAIALMIGAHMVYLAQDNAYQLSYTTDAISTCMLVEFCMPSLFGAIAFPLFIMASTGLLAMATGQSEAWFFFVLMSQTMVVAFIIVASRLRNLSEINQATRAFKQAKLAAESANEAKSRFLAVMSHEIRTPMNSILGLVELMEQEQLPENQKANLADIHASADLLLGLVRDLLDLSRIESGRVDLERIPFSLHDLMRKSLTLVSSQAESKSLHLRYVTRGLPDPLWVSGDPLRLQQVVYNLLTNALKFTDQGWITIVAEGVTTDRQQTRLRIGVRDTGMGIPADKLATIFESFVQADTSTSRSFGGSGLGLAIARELVSLMGGRLEVMSREGSGSEFYFEITLPRSEAKAVGAGQDGGDLFDTSSGAVLAPAGDEPGLGLKVLLIDDNAVNLKVATAMLQRLGCRVVAARDGEEGVKAWFDQKPFDLVFMDCQMPGLDGYQATARIRSLESPSQGRGRVPIIALTANAMQGERERCQEAGMDDYLSKPVQIARMRAVLQQWAPRTKSADESRSGEGAAA
jgi:two-component system, sensor histidine kinase